jgi:hypothetical protein
MSGHVLCGGLGDGQRDIGVQGIELDKHAHGDAMKCVIHWVNDQGQPTPDDNEAVCLAQSFDPRVPDPINGGWRIITPFDLGQQLSSHYRYHDDGSVPTEWGWAYPICHEHLRRKPPFWRYLPLPGQSISDATISVQEQAPPAVIEGIINAFPTKAAEIFRDGVARLEHNAPNWAFRVDGRYLIIDSQGIFSEQLT